VLGLSFGFSDTAAFGYVDYVKPYLKQALQGQSVLVRRVFEDQQAFDKAFEGVEDLFVDGSEIVIERAKDPKKQQADFSGKKTHTLIMLLICDKAGRIIYVGQLFCGSQVDFGLFKKELSGFDYSGKQVWVDLGFTGIKDYRV
jgi:hypothetical protein